MRYVVVLAAAAASLGAGTCAAQGYPSKPIRMVNAFAPGGASDVVARHFANRLSETMGQQVSVENRTGAGGNIAAEYVARAPADGYTLLVGTFFLSTNPSLYRKIAPDHQYFPKRKLENIS